EAGGDELLVDLDLLRAGRRHATRARVAGLAAVPAVLDAIVCRGADRDRPTLAVRALARVGTDVGIEEHVGAAPDLDGSGRVPPRLELVIVGRRAGVVCRHRDRAALAANH